MSNFIPGRLGWNIKHFTGKLFQDVSLVGISYFFSASDENRNREDRNEPNDPLPDSSSSSSNTDLILVN